MTMKNDENEYTAMGTFRQIDRPNTLVFTWAWLGENGQPGPETLVTVRFEEAPEGTKLTLRHEGFANAEGVKQHTEGWASTLNRLEKLLA